MDHVLRKRGQAPFKGAWPLLLVLWCAGALVLPLGEAAEWPSVFRGVTMRQGSLGVVVVSVEPGTPAAASGLQADDKVVRVGAEAITTLDQLAQVSMSHRGKAAELPVRVMRERKPIDHVLSLYSWPILTQWGERIIPDWDRPFPTPTAALAYWRRQAQERLQHDDAAGALEASWQLLHHDPHSLAAGLLVADLAALMGRQALASGDQAQATESLRLALRIYGRASERATGARELRQLKSRLAGLNEVVGRNN